MLKKVGSIVAAVTLTATLTSPVHAWRTYYYPRCYSGWGYGSAAAGGAVAVGLLAGLLIGAAISNRTTAEKGMLDSAGRANQYDNYIIAMNYYNSNSSKKVNVMTKNQWINWRQRNNLEYLP